jgi:hypothetical protein
LCVVDSVAGLLGFQEIAAAEKGNAAPSRWGRLPHLTLSIALCLVLVAVAFATARTGWPWAKPLFWFALALLYLPVAVRLLKVDVSRTERIGLVLVLGVALYCVKVLQSPTAFIQFDEFLHVRTAIDILEDGRLFGTNSLLPVSPRYPGLEIATTAIVNLTGLSIFLSGVILLLAARVVFVLSLFLFIERISASARLAGIACLIYMAHSGFLYFHSIFAYESFAMMFLILAFSSEALAVRAPKFAPPLLCLVLPFLFALAVTHHLTSAFATGILVALVLAHALPGNTRQRTLRAMAVAGLAVLLWASWTFTLGSAVEGYVAPTFHSGWREFWKVMAGENEGRKVFVASDGTGLPLWQRLVALAAVLFTCLGLAIGFFRALAVRDDSNGKPVERSRLWRLGIGNNAWALVLTGLTLGFPISVLLRLTTAGWEIGNRAGAFIFFGVGFVCAVGVISFWLAGNAGKLRLRAVGLVLTILFIGGAISGSAETAVLGRYKVSADALSIEPLGITAAKWTREYLGGGWRFAADRVNRLLLGTYGEQRVITGLADQLDISNLVLGDRVADSDMNAIKRGRIDFIMVDSRLARALPLVGVYFEQGEDTLIHEAPPSTEALRKFNRFHGIGRIFDNGPIAIYDARPRHELY